MSTSSRLRGASLLRCLSLWFLMCASFSASALQLTGLTNSHDPATIVKDGDTYFHFTTGQGIWYSTSTDLVSWTGGPRPVFSGGWPSWINNAVPGFSGEFWAPDVIQMNGYYYLYYSVSTFGSSLSAIGVVRTPSLVDPAWQDLGPVVQSNGSTNVINAIDPALFRDNDGRVYMSYGSWFGGIGVAEINPSKGKLLGGVTHIWGGSHQDIEAPYITRDGNYYYLWINRGTCCQGANSGYYIQVARATSIYGPYSGMQTVLGNAEGRYKGPGHIGLLRENNCNYVSTHYYDLQDNGNAKLDILRLTYVNGWPQLTRNFSFDTGCISSPSLSSSSSSVSSSLSSSSSSFSSSGNTPTTIPNGVYIIEAVHSGAALTVAGNSAANGANIEQRNYSGLSGQHWTLTSLGEGFYSLTNVMSGLSLDVWNMSTAQGANIAQWSYWGGDGQQWALESLGNGRYHIRSRLSGHVLDVMSSGTANGVNVLQWPASSGASNQQWTFRAASSSSSVSSSSSATSSAGGASVSLSAIPGNTSVALNWSVSGAISAIEVYRDTDSNPAGRTRIATLPSGARSFTATGLNNGTSYWFWVKYRLADGTTWMNSNNPSATPAASSGNALLSCTGCITIDQAGSGNIEVRTRTTSGNGMLSLLVNGNPVTNWGISSNSVSYYYGAGPFNNVQLCRTSGGADILIDYIRLNNIIYQAESYPSDCAP